MVVQPFVYGPTNRGIAVLTHRLGYKIERLTGVIIKVDRKFVAAALLTTTENAMGGGAEFRRIRERELLASYGHRRLTGDGRL